MKKILRTVLSLATGGLLLVLALQGTQLTELQAVWSHWVWSWIVLGFMVTGVEFAIRTWRWKQLLAALAPISFFRTLVVFLVGYCANALLPARLGELFRANYCGRAYKISKSGSLGTVVVERVFDGLFVVTILFVGLLTTSFSKVETSLLWKLTLLGVVLFGGVGISLIILAKTSWLRILYRWHWLERHLLLFVSVVQRFNSQVLLRLIAMTGLVWSLEIGVFWCFLQAMGISLTVTQLLLLVGVSSLSTLLPSPPGYLGTLQFAFVLVFSLLSYSAAEGIVAASMVQLFMVLPWSLIGGSLFIANMLSTTFSTWLLGRSSER